MNRARGGERVAVFVAFGVGVLDLAGLSGGMIGDESIVDEGASGEGAMEEGTDSSFGEIRGEP